MFIDNFGECKDLILLFKDYFEDERYKKVWFNYGFDRHVFFNHGIDARGFAGDVMHMARLLDSSREPQDYSLHRVSKFYLREYNSYYRQLKAQLTGPGSPLGEEERRTFEAYDSAFANDVIKISMNKLFARRKRLKSGEDGKVFEVG